MSSSLADPRTTRTRRWWGRALPAIGCVLALYGLSAAITPGVGARAGDALPAFEVGTSEGSMSRDGLRGEPYVLAFWASWCPACRAEAGTMTRVHTALRAEDARVIGLSVESLPQGRIERQAKRIGMLYPVGAAPQPLVRALGVTALPTVVVVDAQGRVSRTFVGAVPEAQLLAAVRAAR